MPTPVINARQIAQIINARLGTDIHYRDVHARLRYTKSCPIQPSFTHTYNGQLACIMAVSDFPCFMRWLLGSETDPLPAPVSHDELVAVGFPPPLDQAA